MFDKQFTLDVSCKDFELIEAALQTQSKILRVQAGAGSTGARGKLNDIKRLLARLEAQRPVKRPCSRPRFSLPVLRWITS